MSESTVILEQDTTSETVPVFGYELLRETLIPDILGEETPKILYWAGKHIARTYPLDSISDIVDFFQQAGWGYLQIVKESKSELIAELSSDIITKRIKSKESANFQLEAGFLAQQFERQKEVVTETFEHPRKRSTKVLFTIKWDKKDFTE